MTGNELLLAISTMLDPMREEIREMRQDIKEIKKDVRGIRKAGSGRGYSGRREVSGRNQCS